MKQNNDFNEGAKAMFDLMMEYTANNWHANSVINDQCEYENEVIKKVAEDCFEEVSRDSCKQWKDILKMQSNLNEALSVLKYYRDDCSGAEPSISVFHRDLDKVLKDNNI